MRVSSTTTPSRPRGTVIAVMTVILLGRARPAAPQPGFRKCRRILGRFTQRGALAVRYREITIRDRDLLARYAARRA